MPSPPEVLELRTQEVEPLEVVLPVVLEVAVHRLSVVSVAVASLVRPTVMPLGASCVGPVHVVALAPSEERAPAVPA